MYKTQTSAAPTGQQLDNQGHAHDGGEQQDDGLHHPLLALVHVDVAHLVSHLFDRGGEGGRGLTAGFDRGFDRVSTGF